MIVDIVANVWPSGQYVTIWCGYHVWELRLTGDPLDGKSEPSQPLWQWQRMR